MITMISFIITNDKWKQKKVIGVKVNNDNEMNKQNKSKQSSKNRNNQTTRAK